MSKPSSTTINFDLPETYPFPKDTHFGVCPKCHSHNGYLNVSKTHWFVCDRHKVKWCVGVGLFSTWEFETQADWTAADAKLREYTKVEPDFPETGAAND
ncbi:hypothetical protein [Fodinicurvata fenggangensis]|uniref:hypothetical protein n=1 Tax=Fodinicurvata fenggangensis TaxID=1121830 RepID=UPI00047ECC10|nr:hypothetical protein [Fodinicurvata fenggangensis]